MIKDLKSLPGTLFVIGAAVGLVIIDKTRTHIINLRYSYRLSRSVVKYVMAIGNPKKQHEALQRDRHD